MGKQRIHPAIAPIDILTREELAEEHAAQFSRFERLRLLGLDIVRFPRLTVSATGATVNITGSENTGPEQGDVWMVRRVIVKSSSLTDAAKWVAYRGSSPTDTTNAFNIYNLLEGFNAPVAAPVPSQPAVPATGVAQQNVNQFPVQVVISANGATITNVSVNGVTVGTAAGTYTVPANGAISIAYSVATPTWVWSNLNTASAAGLGVNLGYYPGTKAIFLQPGEQIYAQVSGGTSGNQYVLDGEAVRVPAEMKGKLL